jgi:hypothetical protein
MWWSRLARRGPRPRPRFRPQVKALEGRLVPSTLFQDNFITTDGGSTNVNDQYNTSRITGVFAPRTYLEAAPTATDGQYDNLTWLNDTNPGSLPSSLRLAVDPAAGQTFTYVSPNLDLATPSVSPIRLHVAIDPVGPDSTGASDHWAAVVFGTAPGTFISQGGVGVLVRDVGEYEVWDDGTLVSSGNVGAKTHPDQFYSIDFVHGSGRGAFTLSIDGQPIYSGTAAAFTTNYVTLEDYTGSGDAGVQTDYFRNLVIEGNGAVTTTAAPDTIYYVSPQGNDSNSGTSPTAPWQSITRVNQESFQPGDKILFQAGATFTGNLAFGPQDVGSASDPITVASYGSGAATINAGGGSGIWVADVPGVTVNNLVLVGSGYASDMGDGIRFSNDAPAVPLAGISATGVDASGFGEAGVYVEGGFTGISFTYSGLHDNGNGGLQIDGGGGTSSDIYVGHVYAYHNAGSSDGDSGYGIFIISTNNAVVERCEAYDNGWLPGNQGVTGGIEAIGGSRFLLQYNEAYGNQGGPSDGDGIILDSTFNSIAQFNYSHDNSGAGLFLFAETGFPSSNNVMRYNVSENDARAYGSTYGGLFVSGDNVSNADVYNNTIFVSPSANSTPAAVTVGFNQGQSIHIYNNIFLTTGGLPVVNYFGGATDLRFLGNDYWSGSTSSFQVQWLGTTYSSLASWRAGTGQERGMYNGQVRNLGLERNPQLVAAGHGGTVGNPDRLNTLTAYQLKATSPVRHAGLDLSQFGVVWDPYAFADDPFLGLYFNPTAQDFFGDPLPPAGSSLFSIGAYQPRS